MSLSPVSRVASAAIQAALIALLTPGCGGRTAVLPGDSTGDSGDAAYAGDDAGDFDEAAHADDDAAPEGSDAAAACSRATLTPWQFHDTAGPMCVDAMFLEHGDPSEYAFASIPPASDPGWTDYDSPTIDFSRASRLCATSCSCLDGVDFDYWQAFLEVPPGDDVSSLVFAIAQVDDGARVTIFNAAHPAGIVAPGSTITLGAPGVTTDLAGYVATGSNRVVLTHVDDCCSGSSIEDAALSLQGEQCGDGEGQRIFQPGAD